MKLIEAMKRLKVIEKRIADNNKQVSSYCTILSTERPAFETEEAQKKEVKSLLQSSEDLIKEYLTLKRKIEKTNLVTEVTMNGTVYTIADLLVIKRKLAAIGQSVYTSLSDSGANSRRGYAGGGATDKVQVVRLYDEKERNTKLLEWQNLYNEIDSRLEVINATTDVVE